jgi:glycosyltransferase involved in cell wall biosynthesis
MTRRGAQSPVFVMPHYGDSPRARVFLDRTLQGLRAQTDPDWSLIIVDDASPGAETRAHLQSLHDTDNRIAVIFEDSNRGQGACRNVGVRWAAERGAEIVLFHDADDISHPRRLEITRQHFAAFPEVDFVYSTFIVIDEEDRTVPVSQLTPSVSEVLETHCTAPVHGPDAWIRIGIETAYTTLTSTVAVRTPLALAQPFPEVRGSEDTHAWFRMSAGGSRFAYLPAIATLYRISQDITGSSDRHRLGAEYYHRKADHDRDGFYQAIELGLARNRISREQVGSLKAGFLRRLAATMRKERQHDLAQELSREADALERNGNA